MEEEDQTCQSVGLEQVGAVVQGSPSISASLALIHFKFLWVMAGLEVLILVMDKMGPTRQCKS